MISPSNGRLPTPLEEDGFQQPAEAELVGQVLDLGRLPLARGGVLGQTLEVARRRLVAEPELAQERPVDDQVRIPADRAREVAVGRAGEAGVAEVLRGRSAPASASGERGGKGLAPAARPRDVLGDALAGARRDLCRRLAA